MDPTDKNNSRLAKDAYNMLVECALQNAIDHLRTARSVVDLIDAGTLEGMLRDHIRQHGTVTKARDLTDLNPGGAAEGAHGKE